MNSDTDRWILRLAWRFLYQNSWQLKRQVEKLPSGPTVCSVHADSGSPSVESTSSREYPPLSAGGHFNIRRSSCHKTQLHLPGDTEVISLFSVIKWMLYIWSCDCSEFAFLLRKNMCLPAMIFFCKLHLVMFAFLIINIVFVHLFPWSWGPISIVRRLYVLWVWYSRTSSVLNR